MAKKADVATVTPGVEVYFNGFFAPIEDPARQNAFTTLVVDDPDMPMHDLAIYFNNATPSAKLKSGMSLESGRYTVTWVGGNSAQLQPVPPGQYDESNALQPIKYPNSLTWLPKFSDIADSTAAFDPVNLGDGPRCSPFVKGQVLLPADGQMQVSNLVCWWDKQHADASHKGTYVAALRWEDEFGCALEEKGDVRLRPLAEAVVFLAARDGGVGVQIQVEKWGDGSTDTWTLTPATQGKPIQILFANKPNGMMAGNPSSTRRSGRGTHFFMAYKLLTKDSKYTARIPVFDHVIQNGAQPTDYPMPDMWTVAKGKGLLTVAQPQICALPDG